jgi:hypothetical protein
LVPAPGRFRLDNLIPLCSCYDLILIYGDVMARGHASAMALHGEICMEGHFLSARDAGRFAGARHPDMAPLGNAPLKALVGDALGDRFHAWFDRLGQRYVCVVYRLEGELDRLPALDGAILIVAIPGRGGARTPALIADAGSLPEAVLHGAAMARARSAGARELHVHYGIGDRATRTRTVAAIAAANPVAVHDREIA